MFPLTRTLLGLLAVIICRSEIPENIQMNLQLVPRTVGSTQQQDTSEMNENEYKQPMKRSNEDYAKYRSKSDSSDDEGDLNNDKRLSDFDGKQYAPEIYSSILESNIMTRDISGITEDPLELNFVPQDKQQYGYGKINVENNEQYVIEHWLPRGEKSPRDIFRKSSPGLNSDFWKNFDRCIRVYRGQNGNSDSRDERRYRGYKKGTREFVGKRSERSSSSGDNVELLKQKRYISGAGSYADSIYTRNKLSLRKLKDCVRRGNKNYRQYEIIGRR